MGVTNLWRSLEHGGAVWRLDGSTPAQHEALTAELEGKVLAVDLSVWIMQAQTQPALLENYHSPHARALKIVFDRVGVRCVWRGQEEAPTRC